jgi:alpha-galactosidase
MTGAVTISGGGCALVLRLRERGMPEILSFGTSHAAPLAFVERSSRVNGMDAPGPAAVLLPTGGMGFFGWPAIAGHRGGRGFVQEFAAWRVEQDGAGTVITGEDRQAGLALEIALRAGDSGVLVMSTRLANVGTDPFTLDRCMAGTMLVDCAADEVITFAGTWGGEFQMRGERLGTATFVKENRRGRTSHDRFPALLVRGRADAGAEVWGLHLGWSGNHVLAADRTDDGRLLVHAGELFEPGEMILAPGENYRSPAVYMARARGLADLSSAFHAEVRRSILRSARHAEAPRPVTFNTWEGSYFAHDVAALKAQADAAAALGVECFVLDDGWFTGRDSDRSGLGDWSVDRRKYPRGLGELVEHVTALGMEFGIWLEPEMVNPDSALYRAHPDWVLAIEGRTQLLSRNQLVLDLSRAEVADHLFDRISALLSAHPIRCIKWDMNRDLTHAGGSDGRAAISRQTRAVYALIDRIRTAHPDVEIESCASGGGRADYGMLGRTHRVWTSDCTDALARLEIQRGARTFLPPEILGAHVSASPNHQTHRRHALAFRAIVAMAYHFGIELDPLALGAGEAEELRDWIALHKRLRPTLHAPPGQFHLDPIDGRYAWGAHSAEKLVLIVAQGPAMTTEHAPPLRLPAAIGGAAQWRIARQHPAEPDYIRVSADQRELLSGGRAIAGAQLSATGLPLPALRPDSGVILEFDRARGS